MEENSDALYFSDDVFQAQNASPGIFFALPGKWDHNSIEIIPSCFRLGRS